MLKKSDGLPKPSLALFYIQKSLEIAYDVALLLTRATEVL